MIYCFVFYSICSFGAKLYSIRVNDGSVGGNDGSIGGDHGSVGGDVGSIGGDDDSLGGDDGSIGVDHSRKAFVLFAKIVKASNKIDV
jgi:hypothetical protein